MHRRKESKLSYMGHVLTETRHPGYAVSQRRRKQIEEVFGWMKTIGSLRKVRHRGREKADWVFTFTAAAYNLVRLRSLAIAS